MTIRYSRRMERVRPSAIRDLLRHGSDPGIISFGGGYPDPDLFPVDELRVIHDDLLSGDDRSVMQYAVTDGLPSLRGLIAARMRADGMACDLDEVLVLQGAQQGLDLVGRLVLDPGDVVVTEDPTFLGALIAFNPCEPEYAPVHTDADGMDPDDLERVLAETPRAKLLYVMPDFQNPMGVTMPLERRRRIVEIANRHDLLVLEDSPYRSLRYEGASIPTIRSLDTEGRVVHLGTFSKTMVPGMRLGWAVAGPEIVGRLGLLKLAADTQTSTLNMAAAAAYLERFDLDAHIERIRAVYRRKRDLMLETMAEHLPPWVGYTHPDGGLFIWLTFPDGFDAAAFMRDVALPEARVAYVPGATFYPVAQEANHARVNFSGVTDERIVEGITRLGRALRQVSPA